MLEHWAVNSCIKGIALASLCLLAGCIVVPKKVEPSASDNQPETEYLVSLKQANLPMAQVVDELGFPLTRTDDGRVYLYLYFWRDSSMETHVLNPLTIPLMFWGVSPEEFPIHDSEVSHTEKKIMLLIEFDEQNYVKRTGVYNFPRHIIPIQIAEEWLLDPLPDYFEPVMEKSLR